MISIRKIYKQIISNIFKIYYGNLEVKNIKHFKKTFHVNKKNFYDFYEIKNCRMYTNTNDVAYIVNNKILNGPSLQLRKNGKNSNILKNAAIDHGTPKKYSYLNKRIFSLLSGIDANYNYFHWFFDSLARFFLFKRFYKFKKDDYFLVQNYKNNFHKKSLKILGIKNIINAYEQKHIKAKKIITVDFKRKNDDPPDWLIKDLRIFYKKKINNEKKKIKIFINRTGNSSKFRDIINKQEIIHFLKKKNFIILDTSKLDFIDEIKIFQKAKLVVGMYGAGLTNIIFCNPKCKIIELKNFSTDKLYENIAKKIKLKFYTLKGKIFKRHLSEKDFDGSIYIDIKKLNLLLKKI